MTATTTTATTTTTTTTTTTWAWHADWRASTGNAGGGHFFGSPEGEFGPPRSERGAFWTPPRLIEAGPDAGSLSLVVAWGNGETKTFVGREFASRADAEAWVASREEAAARAWRRYLND